MKKWLENGRSLFWMGVAAIICSAGMWAAIANRKTERIFSSKVPLTELLRKGEWAPGIPVKLQVLDSGKDAVPWALLYLTWEEGGSMGFQVDQDGQLTMTFHSDMLEHEAIIESRAANSYLIRASW